MSGAVQFGTDTPTVAIVGTEASGKTVLTCVLARRFNSPDANGVLLNPQGVATLKYVERVWNTLQSQEWPPLTAPGERPELRWTLEKNGVVLAEIRLIDAAGHDLRPLFEEEKILAVGSLPTQLRELAEYCRGASVVLFVVNLGDFVGEADADRRAANEAAIKSALDVLLAANLSRKACVVLTQADLYKDYARECGGWLELVSQTIPYVYNAYLRNGRIRLFAVSAVYDTQIIYDSQGQSRRVPVPGFRSTGLDFLFSWLVQSVRVLRQENRDRQRSSQRRGDTTLPEPAANKPSLSEEMARQGLTMGFIGGTIVASIVGIVIVVGGLAKGGGTLVAGFILFLVVVVGASFGSLIGAMGGAIVGALSGDRQYQGDRSE